MKKQLMIAALAAAGLTSMQAMAQTSSDPVSKTPPAKDLATDRNGDGRISRDEVQPGSSLAKRFDERDANHDGVLTADEYALPPSAGVNAGGAHSHDGAHPPQQPSEKKSPLQGPGSAGPKGKSGGGSEGTSSTSGGSGGGGDGTGGGK